MMELQIGNSARFTATILNPAGSLQDVTNQVGQLWQGGSQIGIDVTPTRISVGVYQWTWEVPITARRGKCTALFYGDDGSYQVAGYIDFLIIDARN
jgi:hypothetical protein